MLNLSMIWTVVRRLNGVEWTCISDLLSVICIFIYIPISICCFFILFSPERRCSIEDASILASAVVSASSLWIKFLSAELYRICRSVLSSRNGQRGLYPGHCQEFLTRTNVLVFPQCPMTPHDLGIPIHTLPSRSNYLVSSCFSPRYITSLNVGVIHIDIYFILQMNE